ncbi:MAG: tetraacyldisaccharide 4'-kinase [Blastocatellia bacterium]|nr:tetraacyldisaccharide 4'-kinase [Blastocatellia bacterium]MCX7752403.1 tetraacyldisaccharide 4'-kinase [Blastocatellia bacterium]MDW8167286.1 tetraacyldisaccharide 4'-kinase [Acidobacteriota bacterium]
MIERLLRLPRPIRKGLALLFKLGVAFRLALYKAGYVKPKRARAFTISVGNLTVGGTGKTPLVEYIARLLLAEGYRPSVISRGYGRRSRAPLVLVSDGARVQATVFDAGDEPLLLARRLPGVVIAVGAGRHTVARHLDDWFQPDVHILDDAFQHLALDRDLNLLLIDALDPFGGEELLPLGRLREPLSEIARASAIVVTRADHPFDQLSLEARLRELAGPIPIFYSYHEIVELFAPRTGDTLFPQKLYGRTIGAFCAVGNPHLFRHDLAHYRARIAYFRSFRDHHWYTPRDLARVFKEAESAGAEFLVTTEKDWVRLDALPLPETLPLYVARIEARFEDAEAFRTFLVRHLRARA